MNRLLKTLLVFTLAMTLLGTATFASRYGTPDGPFSAELLGDYLPVLSTFMVKGEVMVDSHRAMLSRLGAFSEAYGCHVYLWQWETLESSGYASFDDAVAEMAKNVDTDTVCVVYIHDLKQAYVQVGEELVPEADVDLLANALLHDEEEPFFRIASFYQALCGMVGREKGSYVTGSYLATEGIDQRDLEAVMVPLHEAFSGYIWVDYYSDDFEPGTEYSALRNSRDIDYDATYARWEQKLDYFFEDAIYVSYFSKTGKAFLDFGERTAVSLSKERLLELEAAFGPSTKEDMSGFRAGVESVAAIFRETELPGGSGNGSKDSGTFTPILGILGAVIVMALAALVLRRQKGRSDY